MNDSGASNEQSPTPEEIIAKRRRQVVAGLGGATRAARYPDAAALYGARGGRQTASSYVDGPSAWGRRLALARWHRTPFVYRRKTEKAR